MWTFWKNGCSFGFTVLKSSTQIHLRFFSGWEDPYHQLDHSEWFHVLKGPMVPCPRPYFSSSARQTNLLQATKLGFFTANNFYYSIPFFLNWSQSILHFIPMWMNHINDPQLSMDSDTCETCSVKKKPPIEKPGSFISQHAKKEQGIWAIMMWKF